MSGLAWAGPRSLIVGNWKMNGLGAALDEARAIDDIAGRHPGIAVGIAPPSTLLSAMARAARHMAVGGQSCHSADHGAYTGEISAPMLADAGARFVILGHSECRMRQGQSDACVRLRVEAAQSAGLTAVLCVGETSANRQAGRAEEAVVDQLVASMPQHDAACAALVVAYEPIWAIGTGQVPSLSNIQAVHGAIRRRLAEIYGPTGGNVRVIYGGSVGPDNAGALLEAVDIDGVLVGGASLTAHSFSAIVQAAPNTWSDMPKPF